MELSLTCPELPKQCSTILILRAFASLLTTYRAMLREKERKNIIKLIINSIKYS